MANESLRYSLNAPIELIQHMGHGDIDAGIEKFKDILDRYGYGTKLKHQNTSLLIWFSLNVDKSYLEEALAFFSQHGIDVQQTSRTE